MQTDIATPHDAARDLLVRWDTERREELFHASETRRTYATCPPASTRVHMLARWEKLAHALSVIERADAEYGNVRLLLVHVALGRLAPAVRAAWCPGDGIAFGDSQSSQ